MKKAIYLMVFATGLLLAGSSVMLTGCTKEGPQGLAGKEGTNGTNGTNGADGTAGCITCHNPEKVGIVLTQFELSKHSFGEASFEEAGNATCAPCHESEGFKYVVANNIPATFTGGVNNYAATAATAYGEITCSTCHSKLHTTYTAADVSRTSLTTTSPVPMTMWAGLKTIDNLPADGGRSYLCVKCHQPRPFTNSNTDKAILNYAGLVSAPTAIFYDATQAINVLKPGYRTHTHYGTAGAIFAGKGGIEFGSAADYTNSPHTTLASCEDCHMAPINGAAGGHTFVAKGNFNGCNVDGCHSANKLTATSTKFTGTQTAIKTLLNQLAAKLKIGGVDILNRNGDATSNLWIGLTTNNYDGYLNVYDPSTNPAGETYNLTQLRNPSPGSSWTQAQKDKNALLTPIVLTNAQMGAIINFQLCLRDYSLGIHNTAYTTTLLTNTLAVLP